MLSRVRLPVLYSSARRPFTQVRTHAGQAQNVDESRSPEASPSSIVGGAPPAPRTAPQRALDPALRKELQSQQRPKEAVPEGRDEAGMVTWLLSKAREEVIPASYSGTNPIHEEYLRLSREGRELYAVELAKRDLAAALDALLEGSELGHDAAVAFLTNLLEAPKPTTYNPVRPLSGYAWRVKPERVHERCLSAAAELLWQPAELGAPELLRLGEKLLGQEAAEALLPAEGGLLAAVPLDVGRVKCLLDFFWRVREKGALPPEGLRACEPLLCAIFASPNPLVRRELSQILLDVLVTKPQRVVQLAEELPQGADWHSVFGAVRDGLAGEVGPKRLFYARSDAVLCYHGTSNERLVASTAVPKGRDVLVPGPEVTLLRGVKAPPGQFGNDGIYLTDNDTLARIYGGRSAHHDNGLLEESADQYYRGAVLEFSLEAFYTWQGFFMDSPLLWWKRNSSQPVESLVRRLLTQVDTQQFLCGPIDGAGDEDKTQIMLLGRYPTRDRPVTWHIAPKELEREKGADRRAAAERARKAAANDPFRNSYTESYE